jgi:hypothetical protein
MPRANQLRKSSSAASQPLFVRMRDGWTLDLGIGTGWFDASPRLTGQVGLSIDWPR